jgi:hypothetical protein
LSNKYVPINKIVLKIRPTSLITTRYLKTWCSDNV